MAHAIMLPSAVAAMNIDALNRPVVSASDVDNGNLLALNALSTDSDKSEVWTGLVPSTANGLTQLWMAGESEVVLTDGKYRGLDPNVQNFYNLAGKVFSAFKPQLGDLITLTADALAGTKSTNTFVNATDTTGGLKPVWGATKTSSVFSMKLIRTGYFSLADGSIGSQRVVNYTFEVVGL